VYTAAKLIPVNSLFRKYLLDDLKYPHSPSSTGESLAAQVDPGVLGQAQWAHLRLRLNEDQHFQLAFSLHTNQFLCRKQETIELHCTKTGRLLASSENSLQPGYFISSIGFSQNAVPTAVQVWPGSSIITVTSVKTQRVLFQVGKCEIGQGLGIALQLSRDGKLLAVAANTATGTEKLEIWRLSGLDNSFVEYEAKGERLLGEYNTFGSFVRGITISNNCTMVAATYWDENTKTFLIAVHDISQFKLYILINGGPSEAIPLDCLISPDNQRIAWGTKEINGSYKLKVWDTKRNQLYPVFSMATLYAFDFSPNGRLIAYLADRRFYSCIVIIDLKSREEKLWIPYANAGDDKPQRLVWSPRGDSIATSSREGTLIWNVPVELQGLARD
jgi:WD40 repeat protein